MPKHKPPVEDNVAEAMTALPTDINYLEAEIIDLEEAIAQQEAEISVRQGEIQQFERAIWAIQTLPKDVDLVESSPSKRLKQLIEDNTKNLEVRQQQQLVSHALSLAKKSFPAELSKLKSLQADLAKKLEELDWERDYAPHASEYFSAYDFPSTPSQKHRQAIAKLKNEISECNAEIRRCQYYAANRDVPLPPRLSNLNGALRAAQDRLRIFTQQLAIKQAEEVPSDPNPLLDEGFRQYVRGRVDLAAVTDKLLEAQSIYCEALQDFRAIAQNHEYVLEFRLSKLPDPPKVTLTDNKLRVGES